MSPVLLALAVACPLPEGAPDRAPACQLLARPAPAPAVPVAALEAVYRRPGFERAHHPGGGAWAGWLAGLRARLAALLESRGAEAYSSATRVLVLGLALAAAAAGAFQARRARRRRVAPARPPAAGAPVAPEHLRERARALAEAQPREALRLGLQALLVWLQARQLATPAPGATNREVAAGLGARGASPAAAAAVVELVAWFDGAFYSLAPVTPAQARAFLARLDGLEALAGPGEVGR